MTFTEHKITAFQKKLADLPDQPNLSAAELKAYFDSSPEELRQAHNALCTDAERLDERVSGIVAETFGDAIPKSMLTDELQAELDAKAEERAVSEWLAAEAEARETLTQTVAQKCEVYFGHYEGDGQYSQTISLDFQPLAVLLVTTETQNTYNLMECGAQLVIPNRPNRMAAITDNGFIITGGGYGANVNGRIYTFAAFR